MSRPSCTFCARKHLSQAYVLCEEAQQGYPAHVWLAIGHMAEAAAELLEKYPGIAATIRKSRTDLEQSLSNGKKWAFPNFLDLIQQVSSLPEGTHQVIPATPENVRSAAPAPKMPIGPEEAARLRTQVKSAPTGEVVGCGTCFDNARKARWHAEQELLGPGKTYPRGRLLILTTLGNFSPSYSLTAVILDQAAAAAAAGYRVTLGVHVGCDLSEMPPLPHSIDVVGIIPAFPWSQNTVVDEQVQAVANAIDNVLNSLGPCKVIEHDLLFQEWFCTIAKAIHILPERKDVKWFHLCHSSVSPNTHAIISGPVSYRRVVPYNHTLLILNYADTAHFQRYYGYGKVDEFGPLPTRQIRTLLNPRDCRVFQGMGSDAATLVTRHQPHLVDVAQIYPLCLTRLGSKHPAKVVELFAEFKRLGRSVRLILAAAHANNPKHREDGKQLMEFAKSKGLTEEEVVFTYETLPKTVGAGVDRETIRSLLSVTNIFAFPSESEAGSLVLMEAAQSGNLLVLNESLPCLADYIPREMALWVPWGSLKEQGTPVPLQELAERILSRLDADMSMQSRRHMLKLSSLEAYAERLVDVLEG